MLHVGENSQLFYELSKRSQTEEFAQKYKKRAKIEPKNAEMKRFHGLARARGHGLLSVSYQAKLTAIAVNLKRISKLISPLKSLFSAFIVIFFAQNLKMGLYTRKNATFSVVSDGPYMS